jgi:flagellar biosynthesis protein FliP
MRKFKEKKFVKVISQVAVTSFVLGILSLILSFYNPIFVPGIFLFAVSLFLSLLSDFLSNRNNYTSEFLDYIDNKISNSNTLEELKETLREFGDLAIEKGTYRLSYPVSLKKRHQKLLDQIEILEKINGN